MIQGALNGDRRAFSPAELAREARVAVAAGAASLHFHPHGPDGRESVRAADVAAAIAAVRAACPGVELGVSTAAWIAGDMPAAIAAWADPLPDMASVNLSEPAHRAVMEALLARGIAVEAGVWAVEDAHRLAATGLADRCRRVLVELSDGDQVTGARAIGATLVGLGIATPQLHHGDGPATWDVLRDAMSRGLDVRVGLEDVDRLPGGTPARDNGELVAAAAALARS